SLLSIAVLGIIALHVFNTQLENSLDAANYSSTVKHAVLEQRNRLTQIEPPKELTADQRAALKHSIDESFLAGFRWVMIVSAGLALLSALSAWAMIQGKTESKTESKPRKQPSLT
ncbi:MAG TPA: MFS transporter, partial [Candidatus Angelobacter sp.]|nr:MFS transporter [Candidatus Angelobacter sp.]